MTKIYPWHPVRWGIEKVGGGVMKIKIGFFMLSLYKNYEAVLSCYDNHEIWNGYALSLIPFSCVYGQKNPVVIDRIKKVNP
jgi:hypothetical protein